MTFAPVSPKPKRLLVEACVSAAFFASGASALSFEALRFDEAGLAFGNDVWASSAVLSAFMLGMAAGNVAAARFAGRVARLGAFAAFEAAAAVSGVVVVFALGTVETHFGSAILGVLENAFALNAVRVLAAFALLLVPSAAMGASLPTLTGALVSTRDGYGRILGLLYGANTAGGVLGVLSTEWFFVPRFGLHATGLFAGGVEIAVALAALLVSARFRTPTAQEEDASAIEANRASWLACTFVAGALLLALEVVWVRVLTLFIDDTSSAFAAILAVVLAGIALGGLSAGAWSARSPDAFRHASRVAYACGAAGIAGYLVYPFALSRLYVPEAPPWIVALIATPLVGPVAFGSGALFALTGAGLRRTLGSGVVATAQVAAINTVGGGLGAVVAGFFLVPAIGMEASLFLLLASYAVAGLAVSFQVEPSRGRRWGELVVFAVLLAAFPFGRIRSRFIEEIGRAHV